MDDLSHSSSVATEEDTRSESEVLKKYTENLLQFDEPVESEKKFRVHCHHCKVPGASPTATGAPLIIPEAIGLFHPPKPGHEDDNLPAKEIEEVLLHIFPPTDEEVDGKVMRTMVSQNRANGKDVTELNEALESLMKERHARPDGICPMRRQMFTQCFNELIRQEILNCPERGVLLTRLHNEIRMTIGVYQTLIHAVEFYASSKVTMFNRRNDLAEKLEQLTQGNAELQAKSKQLHVKYDDFERRNTENSELRQKKHDEEVHYLGTLNHQLKAALDRTVQPIQKKV